MSTRQPRWIMIANLGDVNPVEYGGLFVYRDATGAYTEELEILMAPDDGVAEWTVQRTPLDRLKIVTETEGNDTTVYLVPFNYAPEWPHPVSRYDEWFHRDLARVASSYGIDLEELRALFCSADALERARAYETVTSYHGWDNFDSYPRHYSKRSDLPRRMRRMGA